MATAVQPSPLVTARMAGALWLAIIAISGVDVATSSIVVAHDAAATAHNILDSEFRYRLGILAEFVAGVVYLAVTVLLYHLFKPVSRSLSLFAAICGAIGLAIGAALTPADLGLVGLLDSARTAGGAEAGQFQAMALSSIRMSGVGFTVSMVYFGFQCGTVGYLIARSGFMPKVIGILLAIGGSFYVISSFATFLALPAGSILSQAVVPAAFIGEGSTTLWLLLRGVNVEKWRQRAGSSALGLAAA